MASKHLYSQTLRLPQTRFPMRASQTDPALLQTLITRTTDDLYRWQAERKASSGSFVLHDGPPYANGQLHLGHALNKILKDVINRHQIMQGSRVSFVPGFDCHGLPIEMKALQSVKQGSASLTPLQVRSMARELATNTITQQTASFRQWAVMGDWDRSYRTYTTPYVCQQLGVFKDMVAAKLIYRRNKPVYWSPSSRTALAEAELEYRDDHRSTSVYIRYQLTESSVAQLLSRYAGQQPDVSSSSSNVYLVIWTTTPWTLPANQAVAINPLLDYSLLRREGTQEYYIVATERLSSIAPLFPFSLHTVASLPGQQLLDSTVPIQYYNPLTENACLVLPADYVTTESGTGLVHTAPGHGMDDYLTGQRHGLTTFCPVDDDGCFTSDIQLRDLRGKSVLSAGTIKALVAHLAETGLLVHAHDYEHKYPYDWRTKKPVIQRATPQWFANLDDIKQRALQALDDVQMRPESTRNRLSAFVRNRSEWCISRQRAWGVPIPVLYRARETQQEPVLTTDTIQHIIAVMAKHPSGTDAWWIEPAETFVPPQLKASGDMFVKGSDTLDVWFDSGCSWTSLEGDKVADIYVEGSDQHRGWFQSSLLTSVGTRGIAPYKQIITHGFVLDEQQRKMSKSLGNVIAPEFIVAGGSNKKQQPAYGVDGLRLWAASTEYQRDVTVGAKVLSTVGESLRKIRNTARFMLGNLHDFLPATPRLDTSQLLDVDRYMLHELACFVNRSRQAYAEHAFNKVYQALNNFTASDLSAFYFDVLKDRLYADALTSKSRQSAQTVLLHILQHYNAVIAPITPVLAEEIHEHARHMYSPEHRTESVFQLGWPTLPTGWTDEQLKQEFDALRTLRQHVNQSLEVLRRQGVIKASIEGSVDLAVKPGSMAHSLLSRHEQSLRSLLLVSQVHVTAVNNFEGLSAKADLRIESVCSQPEEADVAIAVRQAEGHKCPRCWNHWSAAEDVPCSRCEDVMADPQQQ
ncbi:isoleucine-tRNA ligase [Sorochytrium milnesiophthora]